MRPSSLYFPVGAVTLSDRVNQTFADGAYFVHGYTPMGNPIGCAATLAVFDVLEQDRLVENSAAVGA